MGKIRDAINNIDIQDDISTEEQDTKISSENVNTVRVYNEDFESIYSYDCEHCAFKRYMEALGFCIDSSNCWIDCTKEIKEELDSTFKYVLSNTYVNEQNAVLYTGLLVTGKEILS